jgi:uncharacterized protein YraI
MTGRRRFARELVRDEERQMGGAHCIIRRVLKTSRTAAIAVLLVLGCALQPTTAAAQSEVPPSGSTVRVVNTDGQRLNVRAGAGTDRSIVAKVPSGATLTVTGAVRTEGTVRWLPVRTAAGQTGWVSAEFVVLASAPSTTAVPPRSLADAASSAASQASERAATERTNLSQRTTNPNERSEQQGGPVQVEAKLKYPETDGRDQEITVLVTRNGAPVPGAIVTLETSDGDEDERFRELDPTDAEGRTRRTFDVRHEKGTVELQVEAVAPDGAEGRAVVSYFKR